MERKVPLWIGLAFVLRNFGSLIVVVHDGL
jgi:hypothetical protein